MPTPLVRNLTLLLLAAVMLTACKKNKEEDVPVTEAAIAGTYYLASYYEISPLGEKDLLSEMTECKRDDEYVLNADKSYMYKDLGAVCTLDGTHPGVWMLTGENNLTFDLYIGKIDKLTTQQLVLTYNFTLLGISYTKTAVFQRK